MLQVELSSKRIPLASIGTRPVATLKLRYPGSLALEKMVAHTGDEVEDLLE